MFIVIVFVKCFYVVFFFCIGKEGGSLGKGFFE